MIFFQANNFPELQSFGPTVLPRLWRYPADGKHHRAAPKDKAKRKAQRKARRINRRKP